MKKICTGLDYIRQPAHSYVVKYGDKGERFYIVMRGKVSVWLPANLKDLVKPIQKLKQIVLRYVYSKKDISKNMRNFEIKFLIDPFKVDDDEKADYASFEDYDMLLE